MADYVVTEEIVPIVIGCPECKGEIVGVVQTKSFKSDTREMTRTFWRCTECKATYATEIYVHRVVLDDEDIMVHAQTNQIQ